MCSIMGEGEQLGIVPRFMRELFDRIEGTSDCKVTYGLMVWTHLTHLLIRKNTFNVQVSYFEIYNEKVYDLLSSTGKQLATGTKGRRKHQSKVRQMY